MAWQDCHQRHRTALWFGRVHKLFRSHKAQRPQVSWDMSDGRRPYLAPSQSMCDSQLPVQPALTCCMPATAERCAVPLPLPLPILESSPPPPRVDLAFASTCAAKCTHLATGWEY